MVRAKALSSFIVGWSLALGRRIPSSRAGTWVVYPRENMLERLLEILDRLDARYRVVGVNRYKLIVYLDRRVKRYLRDYALHGATRRNTSPRWLVLGNRLAAGTRRPTRTLVFLTPKGIKINYKLVLPISRREFYNIIKFAGIKRPNYKLSGFIRKFLAFANPHEFGPLKKKEVYELLVELGVRSRYFIDSISRYLTRLTVKYAW